MKKYLLIILPFVAMSFDVWQPDFEKAKEIAKEKNELILLNFSGSDWCGPCMRMRKEIFDNEAFAQVAENSLVMVNADFPRNKKNQLDKNIQKQNESLADKYNADGKFPFTLLLDADGNVIKAWDGLPAETAADFTAQIKSICDAHK
ncbi:MAG: thioredoxin family protein [Ginsengibacter sp.]